MKKQKLTIVCLLIFLTLSTFGQEFDKLLQGSLYSFINMTNTGSFSKDLRTYYLSEQFRTDLKSGKWGGSVTVPVEGIPVTLGMDFTEDKYNEFKSKILQVSELNISQNFYQTSFSTIPNTNLYDAYIECVRIKEDVSKTGFIQGQNVETEDVIVFAIYYRPQAPGDAMPVVQSFNVQPEGNVISGGLTVGQMLNTFSILVTAKRDPEKDLVLSLVTNRGNFTSKSAAEGSFSSSKELPIGTIVSSILNFEQFSFATKNNEKSSGSIWTSSKSKWAPCDGRPLANSKFSKLSSKNNAPDLRGVFLRGLNQFDVMETSIPDPNKINPENKKVGDYQEDVFKSHHHDLPGGGNTKPGWSLENVGRHDPNSTTDVGGAETRPKNVSIFYYIKIN